ncbi:MAG TPA: DapH/DapD/GlmU-related protein [Acidimicrobiales bacterium]|nr:DapH/DapD/GlmU-related protein [Acidimicrobiales bacterium]
MHLDDLVATDRRSWLEWVASSRLVRFGLRARLLAAAGFAVDPTAFVGSGHVVQGDALSIGPRSFVNDGCLFDCTAPITVGADVHLAQRVCLLTSTHRIGGHGRRGGRPYAEPITIGDGAWIGAAALVLPGVTVGAGAVVAAGAVVTADVPADTLGAGVPWRPVRDLAGGPAMAGGGGQA